MQTFAPRGTIHGPILPQFVLETSISFGAKVMYALLCNYASDNDHCWPSQATLAARLSCSVSSVKKYLGELVGIKLIDVRREQYRSSVYYMLQPEALSVSRRETAAPVRHAAKPDCHQSDIACPQPKTGYINTLNKQEERNTPPLPPVRPSLPKVTPLPRPSVVGAGVCLSLILKRLGSFTRAKRPRGLPVPPGCTSSVRGSYRLWLELKPVSGISWFRKPGSVSKAALCRR